MCLPTNDCAEGYGRGTTYFADIFASQASLTDERMLAESTMLARATEEFWEQAGCSEELNHGHGDGRGSLGEGGKGPQ
jgi:hypothetical protein